MAKRTEDSILKPPSGSLDPDNRSGPDQELIVRGFLEEDKSHSATRFVLPFRAGSNHAPARQAGLDEASPRYREACETDWIFENKDARIDYLITETKKVLFDRAAWWVMESQHTPLHMITADRREVNATILPPAVVLFEKNDSSEDLLRTRFLVIEVRFGDGWRFDDVLLFNELFRYWRKPYDKHYQQFKFQLDCFQKPFKKIAQRGETDLYGDRWLAALRVPLNDGRSLLNESPLALLTPEDAFGGYADGRAFVWARVVTQDNTVLKKLQNPDPTNDGKWKPKETATTGFRDVFGYWVKLLNVDKPVLAFPDGEADSKVHIGYGENKETNDTTAFEKNWAADRTYRRWEHFDCYYGFNNFSGAMLSGPCEEPPAWQHWFQMYFDHALLLLFIRVTLFRYSNKLSEISSEMLDNYGKSEKDSIKKWQAEFRRLRRAFTIFENLYQFPLLSNQQQAIEMYGLARKWMDIDDLYKEIAGEITSSDELLEAEVERERSELADILNWVAAIGLGLSVALSWYQVPDFADWWKEPIGKWMSRSYYPVVWCAFWVVLFLAVIWVKKQLNSRSRSRPTAALSKKV